MPPRFEIRRENVDTARRLLGLRAPAAVSITYYTDDTTGRYVDRRDGKHRISVAGDISAAEASRTIWHELVHASQIEKLGGVAKYDERETRELIEKGISEEDLRRGRIPFRRYRRIFLEREAEALAREFCKDFPLAKRRKRR
jgi:hypothetical protein